MSVTMMRGKSKRRYVTTTDSKHVLPIAQGWLYVAVVIDLFSRQIVGWSLKPHMQTSLVKEALTMAYHRRRPQPGLILHSDRGSQYCSHEFQEMLRAGVTVTDWITFYNHRRLHSALGYMSPVEYEIAP